AVNLPLADEDNYDSLRNEASSIANSLMSEGSPSNWDKDNVIRIGLLSEGRIDEGKWSEFGDVPYQTAKGLFRVIDDFYVYFGDDVGDRVGMYLDDSNESVVRVTRVVVRNNESMAMHVVSWR
ncbi:MAG: hypothetical protein KC506_01770, partial [Nanoarchaeota archaeon]|nr:hypothetical protein [Nanoarchaeota archaeon]